MYKINLNDYKSSMKYFNFFDVQIKKLDIDKEDFLRDNNISPSTYRKCRNFYQKGGSTIIKKLCEIFNVKYVDETFIIDLENKINKIYHKIYYKIRNSFDEDLDYLNNLLKENNIMKPIVQLIKLELLANFPIDINKFIRENKNIYNEIKKYSQFLNEDLLEILDNLSFVFEKDIPEKALMKNYKNSLAYFSLASRLCDEERYAESIFMAKKAETILIEEKNYKRLLHLNTKIMHCLNLLENYKECFELCEMQLLTIDCFTDVDYEYQYTIQNLVISALALKKYKYVEDILLNKEKIYINECFCLLVAEYKLNKKNYKEYFKYYYENSKDEMKELLKILDNYLKSGNKKVLMKLENTKILKKILKVLKIA